MQTASGRLQQIDKSREIVKCDPNGFIKGNKKIIIAMQHAFSANSLTCVSLSEGSGHGDQLSDDATYQR